MAIEKKDKKGGSYKGKKKPFQKRVSKQKSDYKDADLRGPDSRVCAGSKDNDPSWYALNPQLLKDAASFPYAWPLGNKLNLGYRASYINQGSLPGIMVMNWVPTIGYSSDGTSPVNVASINTYTKVRHDNSGHANYDHADYMMYLLAMDSVYAFHSWMRRVYGVALTYSNTNRYFPRAVVEAMGVDFNDLQKNLADFRQYINTYAIKASALAVPAKMSIMTKHYWMSEGLYYDSQQDKPQTYLFNPIGFYKFALSEGETPHGTLVFEPMFNQVTDVPDLGPKRSMVVGALLDPKWKLADIVEYGDKLLAPIISDEDFGIMSGDTLKSFGVGGCYTLPITEETYTVVPSYSPEVLDQIQNATFIGMPVPKSLTIDQDVAVGAGWILADPKFDHPWVKALSGSELPGQNAFLINRFLTFEHGDITPEQTMEASRWTNISTEVTPEGTREYRVPTMGTEVMCVGNIGYFHLNADDAMDIFFTDNLYVSMNVDSSHGLTLDVKNPDSVNETLSMYAYLVNKDMRDLFLKVQMLSVFDRHPAVYLSSYINGQGFMYYYPQNSGTTETKSLAFEHYNTINGALFDVNYYTILDSQDLEEMSHIALLSEFDVTTR